MKSSKENSKKPSLFLFLSVFILSICMICAGCYLNYLNNPKKQSKIIIDKVLNKMINIKSINEKIGIGNSYSSNIQIKNNIHINNKKIDEDILTLIDNLNKSTSEINFKQDYDNKKLYASSDLISNNKKIISAEYLIQNATTYYNIDGYTDGFVNDGTNNYFENFNKEETLKTNINHLINVFIKSLEKSLKNEYYNKETVVMPNSNNKVNKLTLELDNNNLNLIRKNAILDLQKDEKSKTIICNSYPKFTKNKPKKIKILENEEKIYISVYTNLIGKALKYEVIHKYETNEKKIIYDNINQKIIIIENNIPKLTIVIKKTDKCYIFTILDFNEQKEYGKIKYENYDKRIIIDLNLKNDERLFNFTYDSKINNIQKNKSYDNIIKINIKYIDEEKNNNIINIDINRKVDKNYTIDKDVGSAKLKSSLTEQELQKINNRKYFFKEDLTKGV